MIQLDEAKRTLNGVRPAIEELRHALRIEELARQIEELEAKTLIPDFWSRPDSGKILQSIKDKKSTIEAYEALCAKLDDTLVLCDMGIEENDDSVVPEVLEEVKDILMTEEKMRLETLLTGEYDHCNAILSFHPGAGGTEAQDWAQMLYRMYTRWGEAHGYTVKLLDWLDGDAAGIKSATLAIEGTNAYGFLKSENGVHRLVRVSPFDASGRRQTSFASVEVMPEFDDLDSEVDIRDEDIEVTAHRSSGAGGQHINKTDSAIRILHKPTGIVVGCQTQRSQLQNKDYAMRMLKAKLMEIKQRENLQKIDDIKGVKTDIEWGAQIRSYVFMPYTLAKDTRTGFEITDINAVMDGNLDGFINAYLKMNSANNA
ncbi:MAG: peptide chain release factor 2 [Ruminococcaceae bacterium]|nr:peptide chain release factor 2 [Oscillospiraceae bacterium]